MTLCHKEEALLPKLAQMGARALINTKSLLHNYEIVRGLIPPDTSVMAIVKANAYGHGSLLVARTLEGAGCDMLGVAYVKEAIKLREAGIKLPLIVLGGAREEELPALFEYDLTPVLYDLRSAELLNEFAATQATLKQKPVHIKVDTGMGRLGLLTPDIKTFLKNFRAFDRLRMEGIMSHFSEMDKEDKKFSYEQLRTFNHATSILRQMGFYPRFAHIANSAAIIEGGGCADSDTGDDADNYNVRGHEEKLNTHFNLVRPGIMLYGEYPAPRFAGIIPGLKPVMELTTDIIQLKTLPQGSPVSYGRTFVTERESRVATLAIGYADGLPRSLSGSGQVIINGELAPIIGTICMDYCVADVTDIENVSVGDEAVIIGTRGNQTITATDLAGKTNTISYEVLCGVSDRVQRFAV